MREDQELKFLSYLYSVMEYRDNEEKKEWFISFGTLLYFLRDRPLGKKLDGDFDISMIYGQTNMDLLVRCFSEYGFKLKGKILDDRTGGPLQLVFKWNDYPISVDIYFWVRANGYWWHTFDRNIERPKNGIPSNYLFKATPKSAFQGDLVGYSWDERLPDMKLPKRYGTLLDIWYPGWFIPDKNFGQSRCEKEVTISTCKNLKEKLK